MTSQWGINKSYLKKPWQLKISWSTCLGYASPYIVGCSMISNSIPGNMKIIIPSQLLLTDLFYCSPDLIEGNYSMFLPSPHFSSSLPPTYSSLSHFILLHLLTLALSFSCPFALSLGVAVRRINILWQEMQASHTHALTHIHTHTCTQTRTALCGPQRESGECTYICMTAQSSSSVMECLPMCIELYNTKQYVRGGEEKCL